MYFIGFFQTDLASSKEWINLANFSNPKPKTKSIYPNFIFPNISYFSDAEEA